jgi:hypothetical protein
LVLAAVFWWFQGLHGFNPTDDGFVLGQAWRVLHGEVPHQDFTSPRPVGSALMHIPEVLLPVGMLAIGRLIVVLQFLAVAAASIGVLTSGLTRVSSFQRFSLMAIAFLLNVGVWPLMQWHSLDGLFLGLGAVWLASRPAGRWVSDPIRWTAVWLLAGVAPLMKQGFLVVPVLVAAIAWRSGRRGAFGYAPLLVVPGLLYGLWVGPVALQQLHGGTSQELLEPIGSLVAVAVAPQGLFAVLLVVLALVGIRSARPASMLTFVIGGLALVSPTLLMAYQESLALSGTWPYVATLTLIVMIALTVRQVDVALSAGALLVMGFAVSMSWGVPGPGLLAGSYLAAALLLFWRRVTQEAPQQHQKPMALTPLLMCVLAAVLALVVDARATSVYREGPAEVLTASFDAPQFAWIRMSSQTAAYLGEVQECLDSYPASHTALLPDNPGLYPLLGLRNPFHVDWWLPAERTTDHSARTARAVSRLNEDGDWLVLFQSFDASKLSMMRPNAVGLSGSPYAHAEDDRGVLRDLEGEAVTCGPFTGEYSEAAESSP